MIKQMYKVESRDADGEILYQFHIQEISEALAGTWSATKC